MTNLADRYNAWSEALIKAVFENDVDAAATLWAEDCTFTNVDAFGEHRVIQGRESVSEVTAKTMGMQNPRLLKNELLCACEEKAIF